MSKEIKVFNGTTAISANSSVTVYTVPVGRVARVELSSLFTSIAQFTGTIGFNVGNFTFQTLSGSALSFKFPYIPHGTGGGGGSGGNCQSANSIIGVQYANGALDAAIVPKFYYLLSGNSISIVNSTNQNPLTVNYNFCIVEEY